MWWAQPDPSKPITAMKVYVDGVSRYAINAASVNAYISMSKGAHSVTVQAWDSSGAVFKKTVTITVR